MYYVSMLFFGHIAASLLIADAADADRGAAVLGNLLPDVTDKTGAWVLHLQPSRWLAHGLPFYALAVLGARLFLDDRRWRGFALGYAGHLGCDLWAGFKVPWLAPFEKQPNPGTEKPSRLRFALYLLPEPVGLLLSWRLLRGRKPQA